MKLLTGAVVFFVGLAVGGSLGVNIGKERSLFANPLDGVSFADRLFETGSHILQRGGEVLETSAAALKSEGKLMEQAVEATPQKAYTKATSDSASPVNGAARVTTSSDITPAGLAK